MLPIARGHRSCDVTVPVTVATPTVMSVAVVRRWVLLN